VFVLVSLAVLAAVIAVAAGAADAVTSGLYRLVGLAGQIVALVRSSYVEEVPAERLELGALGGMVEAADPGGAWVPEEHAEAFAALAVRSVPPFGLVLGRRASYPYVIEVVPGSAAERAGLTCGEYLERVGDEPVRARPLWLAAILLERAERGGAPVAVDVIDRAADAKRTVTIAGAGGAAPEPALAADRAVPVLRIPVIDERSVARVQALLGAGAAPTLVVDLRGTGLGAAAAAVEAAAVIAGGEVEAPRARRDGEVKPLRAARAAQSRRLVVCVDGTTAGAAEVLAATLKRRGATLVGSESYGDTGQRRARSAAGGRLWLASEWFLGPDGKALLGAGVAPDEVVRPHREGDVVLDRAVELAGGEALPKAA
jgi:carboxyl-terminal processing protease